MRKNTGLTTKNNNQPLVLFFFLPFLYSISSRSKAASRRTRLKLLANSFAVNFFHFSSVSLAVVGLMSHGISPVKNWFFRFVSASEFFGKQDTGIVALTINRKSRLIVELMQHFMMSKSTSLLKNEKNLVFFEKKW